MVMMILFVRLEFDQIICYILVEVPMTIDDEVIEIAEQDYGLICPSSGKFVPLKSFHIRAQIVDATVEVIISIVVLK
jgi:hypothetical protein